eukprot:12362877-Ditylum_brightwellii.AAC.1
MQRRNETEAEAQKRRAEVKIEATASSTERTIAITERRRKEVKQKEKGRMEEALKQQSIELQGSSPWNISLQSQIIGGTFVGYGANDSFASSVNVNYDGNMMVIVGTLEGDVNEKEHVW